MYCLLCVGANVYACVHACAHVGARGHPPVLSLRHRPPCVSEVVFGWCGTCRLGQTGRAVIGRGVPVFASPVLGLQKSDIIPHSS